MVSALRGSHCRGRAARRDRRRRDLLGRVGVRAAGSGLSRSSGHVGGRSRRGVVRGRSGRGSGDWWVLRVGCGCTHEYRGRRGWRRGGREAGDGWRLAAGECGRRRSRFRWLGGAVARGAGRISDSSRGGSAIRSRRAARLEDAERRAWVALGEEGSAPGRRATREAVRALSLICSEKSRDRCSWENFNRRGCEIGKRLACKCTEPAAEMWNRSSR